MTDAKPTSNPSQIRSSTIAPPHELVHEWEDKYHGHMPEWVLRHVATEAAQWGADQELEACCECIAQWYRAQSFLKLDGYDPVPLLRTARRPKPLSLAEEALRMLDEYCSGRVVVTDKMVATIRSALERLQELEAGND